MIRVIMEGLMEMKPYKTDYDNVFASVNWDQEVSAYILILACFALALDS